MTRIKSRVLQAATILERSPIRELIEFSVKKLGLRSESFVCRVRNTGAQIKVTSFGLQFSD